ncbi:hypothetical protein FRC01_001697 [Tulasnella sp. 417]|nr:hypothetical protein FRC01_001697 [Tulasnella sp. 417]
MTVTPATLIPLYIQRIRKCIKIEDNTVRHDTWNTLAEPVSVLLEISEGSDLLESVFSEEELDVFQRLVESHPHKYTVKHPAAPTESGKLSEYASVATLPSMPWRPRRRAGSTSREPDNQRNLQSVLRIPTSKFFGKVLSYQEARPASDANNFPRNLRVPHDDYPSVQSAGCFSPQSEEHVVSWVHQIALQTASAACILHNTEPESKGWNFGKATSKQGLSDVVFKSVSSTRDAQPEVNRLLVEVKCPSSSTETLPLAEMEDIIKLHDGLPSLSEVEAACDELVLYSGRIKKPGYTPAQRVMAQVYDYCQEQKHHFFIITTYEHWMFGVFLQDYTCAAVTEPLPYDHKGPTIVQCITYWLQSSLFLPGSFEIPEQDSMALTDPGSFDRYFTGLMWRRTLRTWRLRAVHELRNLSRHAKTKSLVDACCRSLEKLGTSPSSLVSRKAHLIDRCRHVVDQIRPRPTSLHEWTVILTWLAVVLDPIALDDGLQSLEEAFVIAADRSPDHPITEDQAHRKRKSLVDSRKARGATARLLQPNDSLDNDGTIHGFYWRYASKEVALILDRYLPTEIRLQLQRWNDRAPFTCVPRNSPLEPRISPLEPQNPPLEPRSLHLEPRNSRPEPRSEQLEPRNLHHEPKKSQPEPQSSHLEPQNQHPELRSSQKPAPGAQQLTSRTKDLAFRAPELPPRVTEPAARATKLTARAREVAT